MFPKLYHIKLVNIFNDPEQHSIKFIFKNILSRDDIQSGIQSEEDHRLAKKFQEEVSNLQVAYQYPKSYNIANIEQIGLSDKSVRVVGAAIYYVDACTLKNHLITLSFVFKLSDYLNF
ncbi:hypothetical protein ACTFIV_007196 [Dictyostelium citrinum]